MKIFRVSVIFIWLLLPFGTYAEVYINEIMYDLSGSDTDREWVEIYNSGLETVVITLGSGSGSWRFVDNSAHILNLGTGLASIGAGQYAIIAKNQTGFLADFPLFSGTLFTSAISLPNTSATLSIKDGSGTVLDQVTYSSDMGAKGDGSSLQKSTSGWFATLPTPGLANSSTSSTPPSDTATTTTTATPSTDTSGIEEISSSGISAHSSSVSVGIGEEKTEFEISAGRNRLTTVGNLLTFRATPTKLQNISEQGIFYTWSFGDGTVGQGSSVSHSYRFAGDYDIVLNGTFSDKQAVSRANVKVVTPKVSITRVLGGVEIWNSSGVEINLEGWNLVGEKKIFVFPRDTLISSGKKITFADEVTGMNSEEIKLLNPMGKEFGIIIETIIVNVPKQTELPEQIDVATTLSLNDIQVKINDIKNKLAEISPRTVLGENKTPTLTSIPLTSVPSSDSGLSAQSTTLLSSTTQTATVFEATKQTGFISTIFSWPIRGFNFIRHLFIED